ncbi:integrase family protein [Rhizobium etli]|uniref:Integrase family protein n=1 Tax=Rhizobium etli TaxID=29449 RepID=A0AAN1EKT6_RHIET|nr:tyrosine-type recombinase/integrase [Rhizobium etli]ARQ11008.1 integrase family protein [Rhizobium etli]
MYLWKRDNGFTYQQRIPASVESKFGKSPIRVNLGPLSAADARKRAIILSGAAMQLMDDPDMTREILVYSLRALNEELKAIKSARFSKGFEAYGVSKRRDEFAEMGADEAVLDQERKLAVVDAERGVLASFHKRLETIADAMSKDSIAWEAERGTYQSVVALLGSLDKQNAISAQSDQTGAVSKPPRPPIPQPRAPVSTSASDVAIDKDVRASDPRAFTAETKLGVAGRVILDARRVALDSGDKERGRYEERLEATFAAFLEVVGDHPLHYYLPIHLQDFATAMANVPTNRTKYRMFDGLTLKHMGKKNDALPEDQQIRRLSETTVKEHVTQIKLIWEKATAGVNGVRDIRAFNVTMPSTASAAIEREALPAASVNKWLVDIAAEKTMRKPHKAWLPLVGYLTGMRLAEIVYLQSSDFVTIDGNEVLDLRRPLIIDGKEVPRPLKTKTSVRVVAIHPLLRECGFIDFAKKQRGLGGFVFPHYHTAQDPADAAQKQMSNWMVALGIHEPQRQVFHSLRHNTKAWLADYVDERLSDKQCGHAATTVGRKYGFKALTKMEVQKIMGMPAPQEIDFSPLINRYQGQ